MTFKHLHRFALISMICLASAAQEQSSSTSSMTPVSRDQLCITEGEIKQLSENKLFVSVAKMRAFVNQPTLQEVEARFRYLGPSAESSPLASGELRRQFGLKLRAQDGCNLVYAMWRIKPKAELVVSVKSNPGMNSSAQCDAHGYYNIKPKHAAPVPAVKKGESYTLRAILDHTTMRVYANNKLAWKGNLGAGATRFDGPVGVRTDNANFEFELFATRPGAGQQGATAACNRGNED
jgi:hypothetical protein